MITSGDLMQYLFVYGRGPVQEFVTRSQNIQDAVHYIQVERSLEVLRLTSFVTKDLVSFEKRKNKPLIHSRGPTTMGTLPKVTTRK